MPDQPTDKLYKPAEPPTCVTPCELAYAELDVTTNYSFLRGASHPDEYVHQAADLGHKALAITDVNSLAGVVRAWEKARKIEGFQLVVGARLMFVDGAPDVLVWPTDREAYARLCRLLTLGRRRAPKGECHLTIDDFLEHADGMQAAVCGSHDCGDVHDAVIDRIHNRIGDDLSLAVSLAYGSDDEALLASAVARSWRLGHIPLVATNHVHYHCPTRRRLHDVVTCVRHGCTLADAGRRLFANGERYLKTPCRMHELFARWPGAISRGIEIAARCAMFTLKDLQYEYPIEPAPPDMPTAEYLRQLTYEGARNRYGSDVPKKVRDLLEMELAFICGSKYESYFLTVYDIVRHARSVGILCQGRGSAANSAVCFCLGVTGVDPNLYTLVFERFAGTSRGEPPDIDIDFEHERREEVIQYVYAKYGRERAAMTASVITYRGRSAIRDVGMTLGLGGDALNQLADKLDWWHKGTLDEAHVREAGVDPHDPAIRELLTLTARLLGSPRHLSQHVGGMVIARRPLCELVPIENASMADRTVIEWDKDDLDVIGLFKVDLLGLGMMTAISKSFELIASYGDRYELATVPNECPATYDMACDADTIGVFQIESRAQMSMLPRMQPREFYDLVIEVAIVRPGPIQGQMVHPYLRRRELRRRNPAYEPPYEQEPLRDVLRLTLGVPLFQEQAMRMATVAASFSEMEADQLRRSMASWRRSNAIHEFEGKFIGGMIKNGYSQKFAERCFKQISGFGEYGFPESHAQSFAKLVYVSAWLKRHHPAAFCCALLNSQPMGFYAPAQLVRDAREHGVTVLPVDVNLSGWDCALEWTRPGDEPVPRMSALLRGLTSRDLRGGDDATHPWHPASGHKSTWGRRGPAVRLGLRQVKGLSREDADRLVVARTHGGPFDSVDALQRRANLDAGAVRRLAAADAFGSLALNRRQATWQALAADNCDAPLFDLAARDQPVPPQLPTLAAERDVQADYATTGLSLKRHPVAFVRDALTRDRVVPAAWLSDEAKCPTDRWVNVAGLVLVRQRPGTASGVVFMTLEDETGICNLIIWSDVYERNRRDARHATLLVAGGHVQREGQIVHVIAQRLRDRSDLLPDLAQVSRDFH